MAMATQPSVLEVVIGKKDFAGLAVLITNNYLTAEKLETLPGAERDGQKLSKAFERFNFAVHWVKNVTSPELHEIIREMKSLKYNKVKDYSCILFVFAGHGCETDELYMQDGMKVNPMEEVIGPLLPGECKELGDIPKVFLIDACRGSMKTNNALIPRGSSGQEEAVVDRGGKVMDMSVTPAEGNFLLARSTMPMHKAYEDKKDGGMWFSVLADYLSELEKKTSIDDILTKVNEKLLEMLQDRTEYTQQPEKLSRLNRLAMLEPCKY